MKTSLDVKPPREPPIGRTYESSHAIVEVIDDRQYDGRDATSLEDVPKESAVNGVIFFHEVGEGHVERDLLSLAKLL